MRRCGLLRQISRTETQWQTTAAMQQVIIAAEGLSMELANVELTSRSPRQGKAVRQAFRQGHAMEGVPHVNGGIPEATASMALQTRQRLGASQRHRRRSFEMAVNIYGVHDQSLSALFLMDKKKKVQWYFGVPEKRTYSF